MTDSALVSWLLAGIPLLGALVSLALWSIPDRLKISAIGWSVISLGAIAGLSGHLMTSTEILLPLYLLPLAAAVSILGQPAHEDHRLSWIMTLVCLGLGIGAFTGQGLIAQAFLMALLVSIIVLLFRHHTELWPMSWWGIGSFGLGALSIVVTAVADPPLSSAASLLTSAILLPLIPFHAGYLTALTRLPGGLPSFVVLLLPVVGLHGLATAIPAMPEGATQAVSVLALAGSLYGAIKALAQSRVRLLLAYGSLSFFSIFWWFVAISHTITPQSVVFLAALSLVTSGLLMSWQVVRTRYGDDVDPQAISGLVRRMPQFTVLFSLLALAAMGLPPFGVFTGFIGMLLTTALTSSVALLVMMIVWLAASWYILDMVQRLLFGRERSDLRYEDLRRSELASLLIVLLIVIALGIAPSSLFGITQQPSNAEAVKESVSWNR